MSREFGDSQCIKMWYTQIPQPQIGIGLSFPWLVKGRWFGLWGSQNSRTMILNSQQYHKFGAHIPFIIGLSTLQKTIFWKWSLTPKVSQYPILKKTARDNWLWVELGVQVPPSYSISYSNQKNKMPKNCSRLSQIMFPASGPGVQLVDLYVYSAIYINTLRKYYRNTSLNLVLKTRQNLLLLLDGLWTHDNMTRHSVKISPSRPSSKSNSIRIHWVGLRGCCLHGQIQ